MENKKKPPSRIERHSIESFLSRGENLKEIYKLTNSVRFDQISFREELLFKQEILKSLVLQNGKNILERFHDSLEESPLTVVCSSKLELVKKTFNFSIEKAPNFIFGKLSELTSGKKANLRIFGKYSLEGTLIGIYQSRREDFAVFSITKNIRLFCQVRGGRFYNLGFN